MLFRSDHGLVELKDHFPAQEIYLRATDPRMKSIKVLQQPDTGSAMDLRNDQVNATDPAIAETYQLLLNCRIIEIREARCVDIGDRLDPGGRLLIVIGT